MASFTVRIELHDASSTDYDLLHSRMEELGFLKHLAGKSTADGSTGMWALPTGEYVLDSDLDATAVRDLAKSAADEIKTGSWCLVTTAGKRSWSTRKM